MTQGWSVATWFGTKSRINLSPRRASSFRATARPLAASQVFVNHVLPHTIRRPHVVLGPIIGQGPPEVLQKTLVSVRNGDARRASFPDTHEPDGIETEGGQEIPFLCRHGRERNGPVVFPAQFVKPDPDVDFVDDRISWPQSFSLLAAWGYSRVSRSSPPPAGGRDYGRDGQQFAGRNRCPGRMSASFSPPKGTTLPIPLPGPPGPLRTTHDPITFLIEAFLRRSSES